MSFTFAQKTSESSKLEWVVQDRIIMNDINLIDGRKSGGKSAVVARIIADWYNDKSLPLEKQLNRILWLMREENFDAVVKPRLMQYGVDGNAIGTIDYKNGKAPKPILPNDLDSLSAFIAKHGINAMVIDPFDELIPKDWTKNDGTQMRAYMSAVSSICSRVHCTAFMLRHFRKAQGTYIGDDGEGSNQIKASIRQPLRIDVTEERVQRRFFSVHESNIAAPTMPLQFEFERQPGPFGKLKWIGEKDIAIDEIKKLSQEKVKRMKSDEAKRLLLEALSEGPVSCKQLLQEAEDNGIGERTLSEAKADLEVWSDRVKDDSTGKFYNVWGLKEQVKPSKLKKAGDDVPQLTLEDLQESTIPPEVVIPDADSVKPKKTRKQKITEHFEEAVKAWTQPEPKKKPKRKGRAPTT